MLTLFIGVVLFGFGCGLVIREERERFDAQRRAGGKLTFQQLQFVFITLELVRSGRLTFDEALQKLRDANITITLEVDGEQVPVESVMRNDV